MTRVHLKTGLSPKADRSEDKGSPLVSCIDGFRWDAADVYLFDIDGTLLNSRDAVHYRAFHESLREVHGLDLRIDNVPVHGNTDVGILRAVAMQAGISESAWSARIPRLLQAMRDSVAAHSTELRPEICPGIQFVITELYRRGKSLGVVSGNLESIGWNKLEAAGLRQYFSFGAFSDNNELRENIFGAAIAWARQQLGAAARIYAVGDTPADIAAAQRNRIPVIAVATGIYTPEELVPYGPDMCLRSFQGIAAL